MTNNLIDTVTSPTGKKYSEIMDAVCDIANFQEGLATVAECQKAMAFLEGVGLGHMLFANIQRKQDQEARGVHLIVDPKKRYTSERFLAAVYCLINYAPGTISIISPELVVGLHPLAAAEEAEDLDGQPESQTKTPQLLH